MTGLPDGWCAAQLGDIVPKVTKGTTPTTNGFSFVDHGINFIKIENLDLGEIDTRSIRQFISHEAHKSQDRSALAVDDILFSIAGTIGATAIVKASHLPANTNQALAILSGYTSAIAPKFLKLQLESFVARETISRARGGAMNNISLGDLKEANLVVPPLPEQDRIVSKIEELFSEVDAGTASLTRARAQLKTYRQALLDAATDGRLLTWLGERNEAYHKADMVQLNDLISDIGQGWSPNCHNHAAPNEETWAVMKTTAIQHLSFNDQENKELPAGNLPREHLELRSGDLLITRAGPRTRVGVACLVRAVRPRLLLCDKAYRLRVKTDRVLPDYLELVLNAPRTLWEIEKIKSGISDSGLNLTQSKFLALMVHLPSLDEQRKTLNHLSEVLSNTDRLDVEITTALTRITALRQSILKKAFTGQLVPQDPADEPASALLARLAETAPKPRRKTKP